MTANAKQLLDALHNTAMDAIGQAAKDAVLYGSGVLIMDSNFTIRHVPVNEYTELSVALMMAEATTGIAQATEEKPTSG